MSRSRKELGLLEEERDCVSTGVRVEGQAESEFREVRYWVGALHGDGRELICQKESQVLAWT